jgi:hypothetical protein
MGWEQSRFLLIAYSGSVGFLQTPSGGRRVPVEQLSRERLLETRRISFGKTTRSRAGDPASGSSPDRPVSPSGVPGTSGRLCAQVPLSGRAKKGSTFGWSKDMFHLRVEQGQRVASRAHSDASHSKTRASSGVQAAER